MLKAIIIDSIQTDRDHLCCLIQKHLPSVTLAGEAATINEALKLIVEQRPCIIFIDPLLKDGSGFELLEKIPAQHRAETEIIFTAPDGVYALQAIRSSALDYLIKPVAPEDLQRVIEKTQSQKKIWNSEELGELIQKHINRALGLKKIEVLMKDRREFIPANQIIRCESSGNNTYLFLNDDRTLLACKTLLEYERDLEEYNFYRVHQSHLVNLAYVYGIEKCKDGSLILKNGNKIPISRTRRDDLQKRILVS